MASDPSVGSVRLLTLSPTEAAVIWGLIEQLSPAVRDLLVRIGEPQWVGAAVPWRPCDAAEEDGVLVLLLEGLVEAVLPMVFRVTSLGDQVGRLLYQWHLFGGQAI